MLMRGNIEFQELDEIDKRLLYESDVNLGGLVDKDELEAYEIARRLRGDEGRTERIKARIETVLRDIEVDRKAMRQERNNER
jgi:hypothetical protein